jgi:hypothetical protein
MRDDTHRGRLPFLQLFGEPFEIGKQNLNLGSQALILAIEFPFWNAY